MPNTTSASLKLTVQATGENSGTWGQITNTNLLILEQAIGGYAGVALNATTGATLTFSNGALSDGKNQVLKLTGTITTNVDVIVPDSVEKTYVVENATSGAFTVTVKTTSGSGVTWGTTDKGKKLIYSDGTDILEGISSIDTLKVSTFTSTGIDDNATSTAITIDSNENVGINGSPNNYAGYGNITLNGTSGGIFDLGVNGTRTGTLLALVGETRLSSITNIPLTFSTNNAERMRIDSSGNVGIGTSSPSALLDLAGQFSDTVNTNLSIEMGNRWGFRVGTSLTSENLNLDRNLSGTPAVCMTWDKANGNVGIGTTSPGRQLQLSSADTLISLLSTNTSSGSSAVHFGDSDDDNIGQVNYQHDNNSMRLITNASERMRIDSSGNVGIGTSSPNNYAGYGNITLNGTTGGIFDLSVGNTRTGSFTASASSVTVQSRTAIPLIFETSASEKMRINSNGNIGIGTSNSTTAKVYINHEGDVDDNGLYVYSNIGQTVPLVNVIQDGAGSTAPAVYVRNDDADGIALHLYKGSSSITPPSFANALFIEDDANTGITIGTPTNGVGSIAFGDSGDNDIGKFQYQHSDNSMLWVVNAAERMRIASNGIVLIGKTAANENVAGIELNPSGVIVITRPDASLLINRLSTDGVLVYFNQAGTTEGNISVSGSTVSYNGFTGTHWSRFTDNSKPNILRGTVLESLDEMCDWYNLEFDVTTTTQDEDGNDVTNTSTKKIPHVLTGTQSNGDVITYNHEGTDYQATIVKENDVKHMMSKVSDTTDAKNVYGVFVAYDEDGEGYNDFYVASVGSFVVRIKANETIAKGDLLQSNGDGTAKVQTDDAVRSSSFAKVLSTTIIETYDDGSYLVPCSLMC
jgi:azurin